MGSRSKGRARAQASVAPSEQRRGRPPTVAGAAVVQAIQAAAILLAAILAGIAVLDGKSYQTAGGIAITFIGIGTAILLGFVAFGLAKIRRWSRTPALLTQLFTGIVGIYLVQGHRWSWGIPALVLCALGFILLFSPPSIRALTAGRDDPGSRVAPG